MTYKHEIRVRYGECDQQGVAFNANYMVWMDDATEVWTRTLIGDKDYRELGWEWMVVRSAIEWHASARNADLLSIDVGVTRFGSSSFDFGSFVGAMFSLKLLILSIVLFVYSLFVNFSIDNPSKSLD